MTGQVADRFLTRSVLDAVGMSRFISRLSPRRVGSLLVTAGASGPGLLSPRLVYDPAASPPGRAAAVVGAELEAATAARLSLPSVRRPREALTGIVGFYRDPLSWLVVLLTSVIMCYFGGLLMFWYHAVHLREGGPAINWYTHWLLDSTFGFIGLTPALVVILPLASWVAQSLSTDQRRVRWLFVGISGSTFALLTLPGPIAHNLLVGRGTWIAKQVTALVGDPSAPLSQAVKYPNAELMAQQFRAGLPLYVLLMALAVVAVRGSLTVARRLAIGAEAAGRSAGRFADRMADQSAERHTDRNSGRLTGRGPDQGLPG
jgi:hypothetical protein